MRREARKSSMKYGMPGEYPECYEWIVETSHGVYTQRGWAFVMQASSRADAISICESWNWDRMRIYSNKTGEIIDSV